MAKQSTKKAAKKSVKKPSRKVAKKPALREAKAAKPAPAAKSSPERWGKRSDLGAPAEVAIERMAPAQREIARVLDKAIRELSSDVDAKIAWGNAGYVVDGYDLFALSECSDRVNLYIGTGVHVRGAGRELLEGSGKHMRHVKVRTVDLAASGEIRAILRAALDAAKEGAAGAWRVKK